MFDLALTFEGICGIIYAEKIATRTFAAAPPCASHTCVIDGFAKMPLQASIFAHGKIYAENLAARTFAAFAAVRFAHLPY